MFVHAKSKSLLGLFGLGAVSLAMAGGVAGGAAAAAGHGSATSAARSVANASGCKPLATGGWCSSNWSGYALGKLDTPPASSAEGTYTSISAHWTVPTVKSTNHGDTAAQWIGIDGFSNEDLIQTGTQAGKSSYGGYAAWWEILPAAETPISKPVKAGDKMTASISGSVSTKKWVITISDTTQGWTFTIDKSYSGPGESAEWIVEAPEYGGSIVPVAHTSRVTFTDITVNGKSASLTAGAQGVLVQNGKTKESPSLPSSVGDSFVMQYGAKVPPAPHAAR